MKNHLLTLLLLCAWPTAGTAQGAIADAVGAWGQNSSDQTTVPVVAQSGVIAIAAGGLHTVALKTDGTVVAWGDNLYDETTVPAGLSGVAAIGAGGRHTVVLVIPTAPTITAQPVSQTVNVGQSASFTVVATGLPLNYQWRKEEVDLAGETSVTYSVPFTQTNHAGSYTVVVSNPAGSVTSAPPAVLTVTEVPPTITTQPVSQAVNEWQSASFTVTATGSPLYYQWRKDDVDLVGEMNPTYSLRFARTNQAGTYTVVVSNPVGSVTSTPAVLSVNPSPPGAVVAWGWWGPDSYTETDVAVAAQSGVVAIAAGAYHTVALKNDGSVFVWGLIDTNVPVAAQTGVTAIAAGGLHTVALKNDGMVVAWGWNGSGQTTVPVEAQSGVTAIAAGVYHTVALKNDGSVVEWRTYFGETNVFVAAHTDLTAIAAGHYHTVALKNDGTVVAWGSDGWGQTIVPEGLSGVTAIAAGLSHTVALLGGPVPLNARRSGNELVLTWPVNGFTLESTLSLTPPVTWADVTNAPALLGAQWAVTNTFSGSTQFYHLRKP